MIATATARRTAGDWRGACATADVEVQMDLDAVRARQGADIAAALLDDLRVLAPDLLRWHLPRASHGSGRLLGGLVVPLARYPAHREGDRHGRGASVLTLVAATPDYALAAGERIVLTTLEPRRAPAGARVSLRRYSLMEQRMFWDSSRALDLADLCATRRGAQQITGLQDAGQVAEAWRAAGFTLVEGPSPSPNRRRRLAGIPVNLPGLAGRVREALPGEGTAAIHFGGGAIVLNGLDGGDDSPTLSAELVPSQVARPLPTVPEAVWMRPVDVDLLRFGLLRPDELHPLVAAALAPPQAPSTEPTAQHAVSGPADDDRFYRAVPGMTSFAVAPDGAAEIRVQCGIEVHRIVQRDRRWHVLDHQSVEARESLLTLLGGRMNPCSAAEHYLNTGRHVVELTEHLLEHGRVVEAVDVLCEYADSAGPGSPALDPEQPERERTRMNLAMDCEINDDLLENMPLAEALGLARPSRAFTHRNLTNGTLRVPDCDLFEQYVRYVTPAILGRFPWLDCGSGARGGHAPWDLDEASEAPVGDYESAAIRIRVREAIKGAPGSAPKGWRRWADGHDGPPQDWRVLLSGTFRSALAAAGGAADYTYQRPGRRTPSLGGAVVLPSLRRPLPTVAVIVDTSGSVSDAELGSALSEVAQIAKAVGVGGNRVSVYSCDAAVHTAQAVCGSEEITLVGGGGTNMVRGIKRAAAASPRPDVVVVLTDGYTPWPGEPPGPRVIAGIFGRPQSRYDENSAQVKPIALPPAWMETVYLR